jgi:hypothetical protein
MADPVEKVFAAFAQRLRHSYATASRERKSNTTPRNPA